jgi:hypothetical protein
MDPRRAFLVLCIAASACAGAAPSPHSIEGCDERTARALRESLKGDTIFVRDWHRYRWPTRCRDGETAASCEARARARLRHQGSPERVVYSCTNEPGGYCLVVRHNEEVSTVHGKGTSWQAIAEGLWHRWGGDEVDVIILSVGERRRATAFAPTEDASPRPMIFLRRSSREQARGEIKAAAPGFSALRLSILGGDDSTRWFVVSASCRPKNEPHPSTHEGSWHCFAGPPDTNELTADECFTTEAKCADAREDLRDELRLRGAASVEIGRCSASPRVSCYELSSEYASIAGWQSYRSYYCYPSPQRCEHVRPESLLHASVRSPCFEAGRTP